MMAILFLLQCFYWSLFSVHAIGGIAKIYTPALYAHPSELSQLLCIFYCWKISSWISALNLPNRGRCLSNAWWTCVWQLPLQVPAVIEVFDCMSPEIDSCMSSSEMINWVVQFPYGRQRGDISAYINACTMNPKLYQPSSFVLPTNVFVKCS